MIAEVYTSIQRKLTISQVEKSKSCGGDVKQLFSAWTAEYQADPRNVQPRKQG